MAGTTSDGTDGMDRAVDDVMTIEAELRVPVATAQLVRFHFAEPADNLFCQDRYQLDLCLTPRPRNARACFPDRWSPHRFERIGALFMVPPGEAMRARSDDCGQQTSIICQLHPESLRDWFDGELQWDARRLMAGLDIREANIRSLLLRLAEEARNPGFASDVLVELIATQLAIELARYCTALDDEARVRGLAPWRLRLVDERLREEGRIPTLAGLAALCGLSGRPLTRGFRPRRRRRLKAAGRRRAGLHRGHARLGVRLAGTVGTSRAGRPAMTNGRKAPAGLGTRRAWLGSWASTP